MSFLPDEMWSKILEMGVSSYRLGCSDLCSFAITCRRHNRLSGDGALWSILLALDYPHGPHPASSSSPASSLKSLYKTMFERSKARRVAARGRAILIAESDVAMCLKRLEELECQYRKEGERLNAALEELRNLERVRQASVALNVWQPVEVRGSQRQMVEQCNVPIETRLTELKMEVSLCKHQITTYKKSYTEQKQKLRRSKEALSSLVYNPLETYLSVASKCWSDTKRLKSCSSPGLSEVVTSPWNKDM